MRNLQPRLISLFISAAMLLPLLAACGGNPAAPATATPAVEATAKGTPPAAVGTTPPTLPPATPPAAVPTILPTLPATLPSPTPPATPPSATPVAPIHGSVAPIEPTPAGTPGAEPAYLDDRSTPESLLQSFYNAINRKEYARAYGYWDARAAGDKLPAFDQFAQGYADTTSVQLTTGPVGGDAGAGQLYYNVPVVLVATQAGGTTQTFAGCYTLHLGQPAIQGVPPFQPLAIVGATVQQAAAGTTVANLPAGTCPATAATVPPATPGDPAAIGADRYLDDRSSAESVVRSFYNAINRKEYVRAYSYWEPAAATTQLPPYDQFAQGYADTQGVNLTLGRVQTDAGAGQRYYRVPVVIVSKSSGSPVKTFVGCYTLHLASPDIQAAPPYHPLAISAAKVQPVPANSTTSDLLTKVCQ
jgi:hypothetical protein